MQTNPKTVGDITALASAELVPGDRSLLIGMVGAILYNNDDGGADSDRIDAINELYHKLRLVPDKIDYVGE